MAVLSDYEPYPVFHFFEEISRIPRGSYNEKAVSDYCVQFAKERNLEYYQDKLYNVVIKKPASKGYENVEPLIIQGHLDMVCEKTADSCHDFTKDGLALFADEEYIQAEGTTLGGDDGIAIAIALAILDDDTLEHPRLEVIFTVSEEVGMEGAMGIDPSMITGKRMLNLDSEEEGCLLCGCAGGNTSVIELPLTYAEGKKDPKRYPMTGDVCTIRVSGLLGGHSGVEIHKNRANANVIIGRCLAMLEQKKIPFDIISLEGGNKENVIPNKALSTLILYNYQEAVMAVRDFQSTLEAEYRNTDSKIRIAIEFSETKENFNILSKESKDKILLLLSGMPNGVQKMSGDIDGLVETSLNLGIMKTEQDKFMMTYSVRSSIKGAKDNLTDRLHIVADYAGANFSVKGDYPAWEYKPDSRLRKDMIRIYEEMYGRKPRVEAVHAGLECGIFAEKIPGLDCISYGPDIYDIHSVQERMSVPSVKRVWEYTLNVLKCK